jgi:acetylornithine deacetylase/succinyl-diaminopimelate desuccinylase-like protein
MPEHLRKEVAALSAIHRPSASGGEHRAAEWVAGRFNEIGVPARIEVERAHGAYWLPLALLTGAAAIAGLASLRGRRLLGAVVGAAASAAVWDDLTAGKRVFRRLFLPQGNAYNVIAELGPPDAKRTVVLVAHHDAARSGLIFHPGIPAFAWRHFPSLIEQNDTSPPLMFPVLAGPAAVALGSVLGSRGLTRAGTIVSAGAVPVFADIGTRTVVPGANDNATGVVALLALARALVERPPSNLRVILVSSGSEESIMEGMQGFAKRHFPSLPVESTFVLCVDTVGSPHLTSVRGEGMLKMYDYPAHAVALVDEVAKEAGVWLFPNLRLRNATDGLYALKAGYPSACLGSVTDYKAPANYHWPTDTAENVDYGTLTDAVRLCEALVRRLDGRWLSSDGRPSR